MIGLTEQITASTDPAPIVSSVVIRRRNISQGHSLSPSDLLATFRNGDLSALFEAERLTENIAHLRRWHFGTGAHSVGSTPRDAKARRAFFVGNLTYVADHETDLVKRLGRDMNAESSIEASRREWANHETKLAHFCWC